MRRDLWIWVVVGAFLASQLFLAFRITNWGYLDESIYIQAAVRTFYGPQCGVISFFPAACNYEHPPLAKALEALSLAFFGWVLPSSYVSNPINGPTLSGASTSPLWFLAFRFFQLIFGALSVVLVYIIALSVSKNRNLALLAAATLTLEPLFAFFSRTAFLDIPMVFFALCAYAVCLTGFRLGPVRETWLTGILFGLSVLSKETGVIFILPLLAYHLLFRSGTLLLRLKEASIILATTVGSFALGLQLYDTLAGTPFPTFVDHVSFMLSFSSVLSCRGLCTLPPSPVDWFFSYTQAFWFDGFAPNLALLWLVLAWVPVGAYFLWKHRGKEIDAEGRLFVLAVLLFATAFVSNYVIYLTRGTFMWYYLTLVPGLCLGAAYLVTRPQLPRWSRAFIFIALAAGLVWAYQLGPNFLTYN